MRARHSDFDQFIKIVRRNRALIALCCLLVGGSALAWSLSQDKLYTARADLLFRDSGLDQKLFGSNFLPPSQDPAREAATNVKLVSLTLISARTVDRLHLDMSAESLARKVSVAPAGESDVVSVSVTNKDPELAAKLATAVASEYIRFRRDADRAKVRDAQQLVDRDLASLTPAQRSGFRGRQLQSRSEELNILASLQTGNAELVQPARVPQSASSPKPKRDVLLGLVAGLLLGVGAALLRDRLDRRIKDISELEEVYELPILGGIPETMAFARGGADPLGPVEAEAFRLLRARLRYFNVDRDIRTLLVVSATQADGKTTVAWNLACTAAGAGAARVLIVDADLRRPRIAVHAGLDRGNGLAEVLSHGVDLSEVISEVPVSDYIEGAGEDSTLHVLPAGVPPPNPAELLESHKMRELLAQLADDYDLVIVDTPPTAVVADAIPLVSQVDGVLVVSSLRRSSKPAAIGLKAQLENLGAKTLGVVANRLTASTGDDYYGYGYGYGGNDYVAQASR